MNQTTPNLGINLYGSSDEPGLVEGYVSAMLAIDQASGIAPQALAAAAVADGKATTADGKATTALNALGGYSLDHIETSDKGTKFTMAQNTIAAEDGLSFHAILLKVPNTTSALMVGRIAFKTNRQIVAADRDVQLPAITLTGWSEIEEPTSYLPAFTSWVNSGTRNAVYCVRQNIGLSYSGNTQTVPSGTYFQGVVVAYVTAVSAG